MNFQSLGLVAVLLLIGSSADAAMQVWRAPPTSASCRSNTPFADTADCTSYYQCFFTPMGWQLVHLMCATGGFWDDVAKACVEGACNVPTPPTTTKATTKPTTKPTKPIVTQKPTKKPPPKPPTTKPTVKPTTTTVKPKPPPSGDPCPSQGFFVDPVVCEGYYQCVLRGRRMYRYSYRCPNRSRWNTRSRRCEIGGCKRRRSLFDQVIQKFWSPRERKSIS